MLQFIKRLQQQTRWQIYVRVLPVVFLAVLVVGAFGWVVFTRYAVANLIENDTEEVGFLMDNLRQQILVETLGLQARKNEGCAGSDTIGAACATDSMVCGDWTKDLLQADYLTGVAQVGTSVAGQKGRPESELLSLCFVDTLSGPVNASRLRTWFDSHRSYFGSEFEPTAWPSATALGAPTLAHDDPWHAAYIFPPVLIEEVKDGSQVSAGGELAALLPVLVREKVKPTKNHNNTIYFLSLNRMMDDLLGADGLINEAESWWCVVNHQGRVIVAANGVPTVGSLLKNQHRVAGNGPFAVESGENLVGEWHLGDPWRKSFFGNHLNHWVVTAGQSEHLPVALLIGHEARELQTASIGFVAAVVGMALLALAISIFGVTRVVGGVSARLTALSKNMELVAKGDYSRRIPSEAGDEVGRLTNFFNRMAVSLDETQRQLTEKTRHLEAALENRQLLDRAKDDFLVLISHEVRTPLTAIMGGVNILKSVVKRTAGEDREVLDRLNVVEVVKIIESSGERLHGFMNDAIQMTSIQSSDKELVLEFTPINSLVELGLCGVRELAKVRNVEVVNGLEDVQDWMVLCDARVMKLAFEKILKNAVVHNYDEGRVMIREVDEVSEQSRLGETPRDEDVHRLRSQTSFAPFADLPIVWRLIEVFNTGEAIPAARREALFGKFELVGRIEHHQRGSGLSLPIAQAAVENHGGRIYVNSVKLQGNSFYLLLPTVATADLKIPHSPFASAGHQQGNGIGSGSGDKKVGQVADLTELQVEFDYLGPAVPGGRD